MLNINVNTYRKEHNNMPNVTKYSLEAMKGQKYGKLTVVGPEEVERRETTGKLIRYVWCKCDCGKMYRGIISQIGCGRTTSCGCEMDKARHSIGQRRHNGEFTSSGHTTHGLSKTRLHSIWCNMKTRCTNPYASNYKWYGGRGIKVCDGWMNSFEAFADWAYANGYSDHLEIDRINSDGNYEPNNCRWKNRKEQMNNTSYNRYLSYKGEMYSITQCADMIGFDRNKLTIYTKEHPLFKSLEQVIESCNMIGYHPEDRRRDALIFIDESKADYSNYNNRYNYSRKLKDNIIQPAKNFFMK